MNLIVWTDSLSVGIPIIDEQHKQLISIINDLYAALDTLVLEHSLQKLSDYVVYHFSTEENIMRTCDYPDRLIHEDEHKALTEQVVAFTKDNSIPELLLFLRDWLNNHILGTDKQLGTFLKNQNITL